MKLTKKHKADLAKAYQCAMAVSILDMKAPLRYIDQYVAVDVTGYGTAADEKVRSRKDFRKMAMDSRRQSKGMFYKAKLITPYRPKFINETTALFRDEIVVQIGDKKNKHTLNLWFSTLYKYQSDKWQMVMFHGSMPDMGSSSSDTFHLSEAEKKLKELEQVVEERTSELKFKNRELEIDRSLERVRVVAMAMHKPEDLSAIGKTIFAELKALGFEGLRNAEIVINNDKKETIKSYHYSDYGQEEILEIPYKENPVVKKWAKDLRKAKNAFVPVTIPEKQITAWMAYRKKLGYKKDPKMARAKTVQYYSYSTGAGALSISTWEPLPKEQVKVLERFRNLFNLSYQRYTDIARAEAQAREAQIEAALERVRGRSMAMHSSSEIGEVALVLFQQLKSLGGELWGTGFAFCKVNSTVDEFWFANEKIIMPHLKIPNNVDPAHKQMYKGWKNRLESLSVENGGKELKDHYKYMLSVPDVRPIFQGMLDQGIAFPKWQKWHAAYFKYGYMLVITTEPYENEKVFIRFAKVFEQAYTRFLDLQKAEAQARESEIELGLERVRARAMAMQKSDELSDLVDTLFKELTKLDFALNWCIINIIDEPSLTNMVWAANPDTNKPPQSYLMKFEDYPFHHSMLKGYRERKTKHIYVIEGKEKTTYDNYLFTETEWRRVPKAAQNASRAMKRYVATFTFSNFGGLQTVGEEYLSEENLDILSRFGKVFDLTYTRFNDLLKAEAQAREAQIEAALERVRARTMSMHKSDELPETSHVLFEQMNALGEPADQLTIGIVREDLNVMEISATLHGDTLKKIYNHSIDEPYMMNKVYKAWKTEQKTLIVELKGAALNAYNRYRNELTHSEMFPTNLGKESRRIVYAAFFSRGMLALATNESRPPQSLQLLERFASVFDHTYTRFLDLQKAEAQAREAQIELGLERVRARAMAMQTSNELSELVDTVFKELTNLDFALSWCMINIIDEPSLTNTIWSANPDIDEASKSIQMKFEDYPFHHAGLQAYRERQTKFVYVMEGNEKKEYEKYMFTKSEVRKLPAAAKKAMRAMKRYVFTYSFSNFGGLQTVGEEPLSEENLDILARFGKVFDLTYTRFNDLLKAEEQAREAEIELALERVRARTLAMHNSSELAEVAVLLFEQIHQLGVDTFSSGFNIWDQEHKNLISWMSNATGEINPPFELPIQDYGQHRRIYKAWKNKDLFLEDDIQGKAIIKHYQFLRSFPLMNESFKQAEKAGINIPDRQVHNIAFFSNGYLLFITQEPTPHYHSIFQRFAKVFDQTYTRFLDLQKAEAQSREAQIETALERVRSRSIGMQKSEELKEVIQVVYEQFIHLNVHIDHAGFVVNYQPKGNWNFWIADQHAEVAEITVPWYDNVWGRQFDLAKEKGDTFFSTLLNVKEKNKFYKDLFALTPDIPEEAKEFYLNCPGLAISTVLMDTVALYIENFTGKPYSEEENKILIRFGKVFQQTYTRFLDLQKAEKQTREAEINLAVERVRAKALAMHHSDEIMEVVAKLKDEILGLHIPDVVAVTIFLQAPGNKVRMWDLSSIEKMEEGFQVPLDITFSIKEKDPHLYVKRVWENIENYFVEIQDEQGLKRIITWLREQGKDQFADDVSAYLDASGITCLYHAAKKLENGKLVVDLLTPPDPEVETILTKMGAAFDLAYRRFLDLQQSEAQARESQIQLALERVRARTMAMQHSDELLEASQLLDEQVRSLGIETWGCAFHIYDKEEKAENEIWDMEWFSAENGILTPYKTPRENIFKKYYEKSKEGQALYIQEIKEDEIEAHYNYLLTLPVIGDSLKKAFDSGVPLPASQIDHVAFFEQGHLLFITYQPVPEAHDIFIRFAKVFEQTYTRFLDLQKAEALTRETQIELSLERIRSQAMAMQQSADLLDIVVLMRTEFVSLGHEAHYFWHMRWLPELYEKAMTSGDGSRIGMVMKLPRRIHGDIPTLAAWEKSDVPTVVHVMNVEETLDYVHKMAEWGDFQQVDPNMPTEEDIRHIGGLTYVMARTNHGEIGYSLPGMVPDPPTNAVNTLVRFAGVFDLAYRRFEDLMMKEEKNRETQVELALEKVRSRTMAMQQSDELPEAANLLFLEVQKLGIPSWSAGYNILSADKKSSTCIMSSEGEVQIPFTLPLTEHKSLWPWYEAIKKEEEFFVYQQGGEELVEHYEYMRSLPELKPVFRQFEDAGLSLPTFQINHLARFKQGFLLFITYEPVPEAHTIFKRFAKLFEQTYTRFLDLQKAEEQAREAQIEAGLERVRSRTLAMQKSDELADTSVVVFRELINLGIEPNRLFIGIVEEKNASIEAWATNEDGTKIGSHFTLSTERNESVKKMYTGWEEKKSSISIDMQGDELQNYFHYLANELKIPFKNGLSQKRRVQTIAYFSKGLIGMASPDEQPASTTQLLERFAAVFNLTYTRFNDLKIAEAHALKAEQDLVEIKEARKNAEQALVELQATQKQLVQSEKMASLGELTAGIAHEIQNPLNFVNNFSEVSKELLDEIQEELDKGNLEDAKAIMQDVIQNLEKINHHGKRADGIVKGMLQHSRSSSGAKESTDINALADEYLRLAYHGLRAKDKSFNANMKTDFDKSLPLVQVIPQDIGRVILNLITNAFYAVSTVARAKEDNGYEPTVSISTKKNNGKVEVAVKDNGNGIPSKVLDKIFQPFFTTKPTGQGTGLGLSLAFDIVTKGHGGELKVETEEGKGSTFIISLPENNIG